MATHAFIGGSGGRLKEIMVSLRQINPNMRVVVNAVSMETICEIREILSMNDMIKEEDVVQLQVSRAKKAGKLSFDAVRESRFGFLHLSSVAVRPKEMHMIEFYHPE